MNKRRETSRNIAKLNVPVDQANRFFIDIEPIWVGESGENDAFRLGGVDKLIVTDIDTGMETLSGYSEDDDVTGSQMMA